MTKYVSLDNLTRYNSQIKNIINSNIIQYSTMPTASANTVDKIVQYIGTTTNDYTNGYFYKGISETENDVTTYSWSNIDVQGSSDSDKLPIYDFYSTITTLSSAGATTLSADDRSSLSEIINDVYSKGHHSFGINFSYKKNYGSSICFTNTDNVGTSLIENKPTTYTFYTLTTQNSDYQSLIFIYTWRLLIRMSWNGDVATVTEATVYRTSGGFISTSNTMAYTPTSNYHPATKKYVDDAVASAGGSVPSIVITLSQIVSQDPIQISLTAEQQAIIEDTNIGTLIVDGSALGVTPAYCQKNEDGSTDTLLAAFSFDWNLSSGFIISNTTIFAGHYDKQTHILTIVNTPLLGSTPTADNHLANKKYVDDAIAELTTTIEDTATNNDIDSLFN